MFYNRYIGGIGLLCLSTMVQAADLNISQKPLQILSSVEPNVMILLDTSGSMNRTQTGGWDGDDPTSRIAQAKDAARNVIQSAENIRFCLARLDPSYFHQGGRVLAECGTDKAKLLQTVNGINADGSTPISEAYYEMTRYFRGMPGHFDRSVLRYTSPITESCQKNFVIVISDGEPAEDNDFKGLFDDPAAGKKLPNWDPADDDVNPNYIPRTDPNNPDYIDLTGGLYLDDLAKFGWDTDLSDSLEGNQNLYTYTVGFLFDHPMLKRAAALGHGQYFLAGNEAELTRVLNEALEDISRKSFSTAGLGASSGSVSDGLNLYQGRFNAEDWSGELFSYTVEDDPNRQEFGTVSPIPAWEAGEVLEKIDPDKRVIITAFDDGKGGQEAKPLRWNRLSKEQRQRVFDGKQGLAKYLRGEEIIGLRKRNTRLGDIVNSSPVYVAAPVKNYVKDPGYTAFKQTHAKRDGVVYVGANDGMLHGFRADDGKEVLAYVPMSQHKKLKLLADPDYEHRYFVDGSPTVADAFINNQWRTILVAGLRAGGQSVYALDITNPKTFSENSASNVFLWEFHDAMDADLGYTFSRPNIIKMADGKWYAVFGNGYNNTEKDGSASSAGESAIYIVDLETGTLTKKISTREGRSQAPQGVTTPNGMSSLTPISTQSNGIYDLIYGADLYGNVWKFDVSDPDPQNWKLAYKLFQACSDDKCDKSSYQPITSAVTVTKDRKRDDLLILVGTGKRLEFSDNSSRRINSVYGLYDTGKAIQNRSALLEQRIKFEINQSFTGSAGEAIDRKVRVTSNKRLQQSQRGWFMDLSVPGQTATGEGVTVPVKVRGDRVMIAYETGGDDVCKASGSAGLMTLDKASGSRLKAVSVDLNRDGKFDDSDKVTDPDTGEKVTTSSISTDNGSQPGIASAGDKDVIYISDNDEIRAEKTSVDSDSLGRQSWRYFER